MVHAFYLLNSQKSPGRLFVGCLSLFNVATAYRRKNESCLFYLHFVLFSGDLNLILFFPHGVVLSNLHCMNSVLISLF
jgi:hypothetical protein